MKATVTAKQPRRLRAGLEFGPAPVEVDIVTVDDAARFSAVLGDPVLVVADRDAVAAHVDKLLKPAGQRKAG